MATIRQLIEESYRVIRETQEGGNTQLRIGNLYLGIIEFLDVLDQRTIDGYEYDDTALKEAIAKIDEAIERLDRAVEEAVALASQERDRLDGLINELDTDIEEKVNRMLDDASWLEEHARNIREVVNEGEIYWQSGWDANIEAYLQEVGVWARDGDVIKTQWSQIKQDVSSIQSTVAEVQTDLAGRPTSTQWSQITQKVNSIELAVNKLIYEGEFTEALQASITQSIDNNIASLSLETTYAKKDTEGAKEILEWMYAAFKNASSSEMSYAEMIAAGKSGVENGVSEVRTYVNAIRDGDFLKYEAVSSIESKVDDVITGLYNKATADDAKTTIFSQVKKDSSDIATIVTHCTRDYSSASIATKFDSFVAGITFISDLERAQAALAATLRNDINNATAGLVAEATMEAAFASMTAQFNNKLAGFIAYADFEQAFVTMIAEDEDSGAVAQIFAVANAEGSTIKLSADQVIMTDAFANSITANTAFIGFLEGGDATFKGDIIANSLTLGPGVQLSESDIEGLEDDLDVKLDSDDITISEQTTADGLTKRTITVGDKSFTEIEGGDFVLTNIGIGTDESNNNYVRISKTGLLKARNAIIYGTIYASAGSFSGKITAEEGSIGGWEITEDTIRSVNKWTGLYSGSDYNSDYNDAPVRFWAGGVTRDSAPLRITQAGSIYATKGRIGGFTLSGNGLTNKNEEDYSFSEDSYIILRNDPMKSFVGIGPNVMPVYSSMRALGRFEVEHEDEWWGGYNTALYLRAKNGNYNSFAFYGVGNGVLDGWVGGYKLSKFTIAKANTIYGGEMSLKENNIWEVNCKYSNSGVELPRLSDVRRRLGISDSTNFCIRFIIHNDVESTEGFSIFGRNDTSSNGSQIWNIDDLPIIYHWDGGVWGDLAMGEGDTAEFLLIYDTSVTGTVRIGDKDAPKKYTARIINRQD